MTRLIFQTVLAIAVSMVVIDVIKSVLSPSNAIVQALTICNK